MKTVIAAVVLVVIAGGLFLAYDAADLSGEKELAFRAYVLSVRVEAQVAECRTRVSTWQSDYPTALKDWLVRNDKLVSKGRPLFEKMVAKAAAEGPRKVTLDDALGDVRRDAVSQISPSTPDYVVKACTALGQQLMGKADQRSYFH